MANGWITPTVRELRAQLAADLNGQLTTEDALIRRALMWALTWAVAGAVYGVYSVAEFIARQIIPSGATGTFLRRWATLFGITPRPAVAAVGSVAFTGTNGVEVPTGTELQRTDGARFITTADGTIVAGTAVIPVVAVLAGLAGNTDAGSEFTLVAAIAGIDSVATVSVELRDGLDEEADVDLARRLDDRLKRPPQGGSRDDYRLWCRAAIPGTVDQVWTRGGIPALGQVTSYCTVQYDGSDPESIIPTPDQLATIQAYVDPRIPVDCDGFTAAAPVALPVTFDLSLSDDTEAIHALVATELTALFQRRSAALDATTILNSELRQAIGRATEQYLLLDVLGLGPLANLEPVDGSVFVLGTVTYS